MWVLKLDRNTMNVKIPPIFCSLKKLECSLESLKYKKKIGFFLFFCCYCFFCCCCFSYSLCTFQDLHVACSNGLCDLCDATFTVKSCSAVSMLNTPGLSDQRYLTQARCQLLLQNDFTSK